MIITEAKNVKTNNMITKKFEKNIARFISKKIITFILVLFVTISNLTFAKTKEEPVRAMWIATIVNLNYPKTQGEAAQKAEFVEILDKCKNMGINTIFMQVRPKGDAFYKSKLNPWSEFLTGTQGKDPGWDPLAFMVREAHKRGMKLEAWLNPYRITRDTDKTQWICDSHPAKKHPKWILKYKNAMYYNPANREVKKFITETVMEIVNNYDVDGIHFDDYFWPHGYPLPKNEDKDGPTGNARRKHVDDLIQMIHLAIKKSGKNIKFGISPVGICVNEPTGKYGKVINGGEGRYSVFADARTWIKNGWIDYIIPQVYWSTTHKAAPFEPVVRWWIDATKGTGVDLYIGHGIYKDDVASEIKKQLTIVDKYGKDIKGSAFFSYEDVRNNRKGCVDIIRRHYRGRK